MGEINQQLTRRQVLAGAGAAGLGAIAFGASKAHAAGKWDQEADIVVVGSGAAGSSAAVTAHDNGDSVVMIEKAPIVGGTAKKSAGVLWIPNNFTLRAKGIDDGREDCLRFLARFSYPEKFNASQPNLGLSEHEYSLLAAFYDNSSKVVDAHRASGALNLAEWRMFALDHPATDYLDNVPENKVPTGRAIGPLKPDGKMGAGVDLIAQYSAAIGKRGIPVLLNHRAVRLVLDASGRVVGIETDNAGKTMALRARKAVVFGSGGYAHNRDFTDTYQRNVLYGACAMPWSTGDFISIGGAAGARMGNLAGAWRAQIVLEEALENPNLAAGVFFPPGDSMLQVNRYGKRAVDENRNYNDRTQIHGQFDPTLADYPNHLMFMIWDQRTAEAFAGVYPIPEKPEGSPHVLHGETLDALSARLSERLESVAGRTGNVRLAPDFTTQLKATIERFNGFARKGVDEDFHRGVAGYDREWFMAFSPMRKDTPWKPNPYPVKCMHPLRDKGPYYALILAGGALDTCGGPMIDARARVLDSKNAPIPGLYGAGNCIASPSRFAYWGAGHTLANAITFGFIAANEAHRLAPADA